METPPATRPIPGTYGLPLIGLLRQTRAFLRDWRAFYDDCRTRYGSTVFRAAAGVRAVTILDHQGIDAVFDTRNVRKLYGFGPLKPPPARIGSIVPTVFTNDAPHAAQKAFLLELQRRRAATMLASFDQTATPYFESWTRRRHFDWGPDLSALMSDFLFVWFLGTRPDPRDVEGWGLELLPRVPFRLPWQDAPVVARLERLLHAIRTAPMFPEVSHLAADVADLDAETAAKQLLFYLGFNAWTGLHSVVRSAIGELTLHPDWRHRAAAEIAERTAAGAPLTAATLEAMPVLRSILKECLRLHQPAPFAYGEARKDIVVTSASGAYLVRAGELVHAVLGYAHRDPAVFAHPDVFDPRRFLDGDNDRHLIWAHGRDDTSPAARDHMCAGRDILYLTLMLFFVRLLPTYEWTLSEPTRWNEASLQPANRPETPIVCTMFRSRDAALARTHKG